MEALFAEGSLPRQKRSFGHGHLPQLGVTEASPLANGDLAVATNASLGWHETECTKAKINLPES
jgi:hypothetical protein